MSKTLEQVKSDYAKSYGCITWEEYKEDLPLKDLETDCFEVAEHYAKEQNKELIEMLNHVVKNLHRNGFPRLTNEIQELLTKYK